MEFRLEPTVEEAPRQKPLRWLNERMAQLLVQAICAIVPPGPARDNLLVSVKINTRGRPKPKGARTLDAELMLFVTRQLQRGAARPYVSLPLWQFIVFQGADRGSGLLRHGPRELARLTGFGPGHVGDALRELVDINALVKREDVWPTGLEYAVNPRIFLDGARAPLLDDDDEGALQELRARPGRKELKL